MIYTTNYKQQQQKSFSFYLKNTLVLYTHSINIVFVFVSVFSSFLYNWANLHRDRLIADNARTFRNIVMVKLDIERTAKLKMGCHNQTSRHRQKMNVIHPEIDNWILVSFVVNNLQKSLNLIMRPVYTARSGLEPGRVDDFMKQKKNVYELCFLPGPIS